MDHTIGLRHPQLRLPAPAGGASQAKASLAPKAPAPGDPALAAPAQAAPAQAAPAQSRPAFNIELFDDDLRPGQQYALLAYARAAPANPPVAQVGNLDSGPEPGPETGPETGLETLGAAPRRDIGDADPERWQRQRVDDVPQVELTLDDFLDIINPLQHIPVVSTLYRSVTGDQITGPARIIGDTLFGGPIGFVASLVNAITEEVSGRDLGGNALAALIGDDAGQVTAPEVQTAAFTAATTQAPLPTIAAPVPGRQPEAAAPSPGAPAGSGAGSTAGSAAGGADHDPDAPGALSGRAALEAYVNDLRDIGRGGAAAPVSAGPPAPARLPEVAPGAAPGAAQAPVAIQAAVPATPRAIQGARTANPPLGPGRSLAGSHPALFATLQARAPAAPGGGIGSFDPIRPGAAFPDRMREALDKYQAISGARATNDDRRLDENL